MIIFTLLLGFLFIISLLTIASKRGVSLTLLFGGLWLLYGVYETLMITYLCTGECNIRIDLLFIYPILALVSFAWLFQTLSQFFQAYRKQA